MEVLGSHNDANKMIIEDPYAERGDVPEMDQRAELLPNIAKNLQGCQYNCCESWMELSKMINNNTSFLFGHNPSNRKNIRQVTSRRLPWWLRQ